MAVTMATAEQALKILYLGVVTEQLNTKTNPLYNQIATSTKDISGKEVRKMAPFGINGGVGAGTETGELPASGGNNYIQFVSDTKNLFGTITISDKSIQASKNSAGAFVNLLNAELEGLMKASKFNLGRMLFDDGVGILTLCDTTTNSNIVSVVSCKKLIEGLTIDIINKDTGVPITGGSQRRILAVDRAGKKILLDKGGNVTTDGNCAITVQNSYGKELTGMAAIFKKQGSLYGVDRSTNYWMIPYMQEKMGIISDIKIQKAIDYLDEVAGSTVNYISCSSGVKRSYQEYLEATKRNVNTMDLKGGFTALSYNGIPLTSDKFETSQAMRLLNTKDFTIHHMGDWRWLNDNNGNVLTQVAKTPIWTATLVRYCEMICDHPGGQAFLTEITEDDGIV